MPRVLIVEDDAAMRDMVGYALAEEGLEVEAVADGESALEIFSSSGPFDVVILDIMLPGIDGVTVCKELTSKSDVPVVMLTARDDETSVVVGLEVGADDYVTKPFSHRELVSRIRATLRRRRVVAQGTPVDLTTAQFDILLLLASHPGRVYGRGQIMKTVWGSDFSGDSRAADMQISNIREKIELDPKNPRHVLTVRGAGYRFAEREAPPSVRSTGIRRTP